MNNNKAEGPPVSQISNQNLGSASLNRLLFSFGAVKIVFEKIIDYSTLVALAHWLLNDKARARALFIQIVLPKYCRKNFISGLRKKYFKLLLDILSEMLK